MRFAVPLPWWLLLLVVCLVVAVAVAVYRRPLSPLAAWQRAVLTALRALVLAALALMLFRPVTFVAPDAADGARVLVVVDTSRSMRLSEPGRPSRLARALERVTTTLLPRLSPRLRPLVLDAADTTSVLVGHAPAATGRRSDLLASVNDARSRDRGQPVAGVVLLSDGDATDGPVPAAMPPGPPVYTVGVGAGEALRDREVTGLVAGDPRLDNARVTLRATVVSQGFGRTPFDVQLRENGRPIESQRVVPTVDAAPLEVSFTVQPSGSEATRYTVAIAAEEPDGVPENDVRHVLIAPAARPRRVLVVEGAPGFEHAFLQRALARDPALELDILVRKGRNADGHDTFLAQTTSDRAATLANGLPARRDDLFAWDVIVLANMDADALTRTQLSDLEAFVSVRGGGLLLLGGRSFWQKGFIGTALEPVVPLELVDRRSALVTASPGGASMPHDKLVLSPDGDVHPIMQLADDPSASRSRWAEMPALSAVAPLGGPRPGASVLAVAATADGGTRALVAVQRYGRGRAMVFTGEASWRWKMLMPADDRSHETFWRQAVRWLGAPVSGPVTMSVRSDGSQRQTMTVDVDSRNAAFEPVADAAAQLTVTAPDGTTSTLTAQPTDVPGRSTIRLPAGAPGTYHLQAESGRAGASLGRAETWVLTDASDEEFAAPRTDEAWLRALALATGGRYASLDDLDRVAEWVSREAPRRASPEPRDAWHRAWVISTLIGVLCLEWVLRRRWGLR